MKSIFNKVTRVELIARISSLNENSLRLWGKMNLYQMLKHCILYEEMIVGKNKYKRVLIGRLLGRLALKNVMRNDNPMIRNAPTVPELRINENGEITAEKNKWITLIEAHEHFSNQNFVHPFYGMMTIEQIGYHAYKHADHHLRQFNV